MFTCESGSMETCNMNCPIKLKDFSRLEAVMNTVKVVISQRGRPATLLL